jgi:hypothetical protein
VPISLYYIYSTISILPNHLEGAGKSQGVVHIGYILACDDNDTVQVSHPAILIMPSDNLILTKV